MSSEDIPERQWPDVLDMFSRSHLGQDADVDLLRGGAMSVSEARGLPLIGVTYQGGPEPAIEVIAGRPGGPHVRHHISEPLHVRYASWNDGQSGKLEIESEEGLITQVTVGPPDNILPPGLLADGVPPA